MAQLLKLEGFEDQDSIEPKDLPGKLAEAVKGASECLCPFEGFNHIISGFHEHARFFMVRFAL